jgi:hypothetical protein
MNLRIFLFSILAVTVVIPFTLDASPAVRGSIRGTVIDAATQTPLIGVNVIVDPAGLGDATDMQGAFVIENVPAGSYNLRFSYIGYEPLTRTDVIVRSKRITYINAELRMSAVVLDQVVVTGGYFSETEEQPTSVTSFSNEEIRRAPGSAGDVSRIILGLPSIAKVNDQTNSLIVRGGSPIENAFFVDNIEIPNINHFPTQGTSSGPIGILNVDFIQDVDFYSGGFSASYGDRLSSVMDITFREGNRQEFDGQLDLNFAGFGGVAEGPLGKTKGSWMVSVRRSYLDLLVKTIDVGTSVAPRFGDIQWKTVYDMNSRHRLTFLGIWADDHNNNDKETAVENDMIVYGHQSILEGTTGLNWRAIWNGSGYSRTSLSYTRTKFKEDAFETGSQSLLVRNRSTEGQLKLRNVNHFRMSDKHSMEFGIEARRLIDQYDNFFAPYTDALGDSTSALALVRNLESNKAGIFIDYSVTPFHRFTSTVGLRADYFSFYRDMTLSPRISASYQLTGKTRLNASLGRFSQSLPMLLLAQNDDNKDLDEPVAVHYIAGLSHLLTESTRLSLEVYRKDYRNFPTDPAQPSLFLLDELFYRYGFFFSHENLSDAGKASATGIELLIQKKLVENWYGMIGGSYFRTRYQGGDGRWRNRVFDNRFLMSLEGGYKPNERWEFSLRWVLAGGAPYTPFDLSRSESLNRAVLDESKINRARYPAYHSLNVRFDRRFHYRGSTLVFYLSVWNAYNRENVATYYWNQQENASDVIYQWTTLPIFGLEYEF